MKATAKYWIDEFRNKSDYWLVVLMVASMPYRVTIFNVVLLIFIVSKAIHVIQNKGKLVPINNLFIKAVWCLPALFFLYAFSLLYSSDIKSGLNYLHTFLPLLIVPVFFHYMPHTIKEKNHISEGFIISNIFAVVINLVRAAGRSIVFDNGSISFDASVLGDLPFWYSIDQGGNFFFYHQFSTFMHPTYWAFYLQFCLFELLERLTNPITRQKKLILIAAIFLLFAIYLCSSRIIIISTLIVLVGFAITQIYKTPSFRKVLIGVMIFLSVIFTITLNPRFNVLYSSDLIKLNSNRIETWTSAIEVFKMAPIFGVGLGDSQNLLNEKYREKGYVESFTKQYNEHNQYLQILDTLGILGLGLFIFTFFRGLKAGIQEKSYSKFNFIFSIMLVCLVENILVRRAGVMFFSTFYCIYFSPTKD